MGIRHGATVNLMKLIMVYFIRITVSLRWFRFLFSFTVNLNGFFHHFPGLNCQGNQDHFPSNQRLSIQLIGRVQSAAQRKTYSLEEILKKQNLTKYSHSFCLQD